MTASHLTRKLSLLLAGLALTACADVGGEKAADAEFPVVKSTDQDVVICQSIRTAIQKDLKAAADAKAAGKASLVAQHEEQAMAGVEGAKTVKGCDVTDLVPAGGLSSASPSPS